MKESAVSVERNDKRKKEGSLLGKRNASDELVLDIDAKPKIKGQ